MAEEFAAGASSSATSSTASSSSSSATAASPSGASMDVIPDGVVSAILSKLVEARRIAQAATVCRRWRDSAAGVHVLRLDFMGDFGADDHSGTCGLSSTSEDDDDDDDDDEDDDDEYISDDDDSSSCSGSEHNAAGNGHGGDGGGGGGGGDGGDGNNDNDHDHDHQHRYRIRRLRFRRPDEILHIYTQMLDRCSALRRLLIDRFVCRTPGGVQKISSWITNLRHSLEVFHFRGRFDLSGRFLRALATCSKLRELELIDEMGGVCGCQSSKFDIDDADADAELCFPSLRRCVFQDMLMTDRKLERFVGLCPALEDLKALHLFGLESPSLVSATLLHLKLVWKPKRENCFYVDEMPLRSLKLSCPRLESLELDGAKEVHLDGSALVELRALCYFKPVFKTQPTLKLLELANKGWTTSRVYQFLDMAKSARDISMRFRLGHNYRKQPMSFPEIFEGFSQLRCLKIGLDMFEALQIGSVSKSVMHSPPPLQEITLVADSGNKNTINLLAGILECHTLASLRLNLMERPSGAFCTSLLKLQSQHHGVSIVVEAQDTDEEDESEYEDDISFSDADNDENGEELEDYLHQELDDYEETPSEFTDYEDLP